MKTLGRLAVHVFLFAALAACGKVSLPSGDASVTETSDAASNAPDAASCEGTLDSCGVCEGNDANKDCAGTCFGTAVSDVCGTCDSEPSNDCVRDCAGNFGGTATVDSCGVCDNDPTNDCWADGITGTLTITEMDAFNVGSGSLRWSLNSTQRGFFYSGSGFTNPPVGIASVASPGPCGGTDPGYNGLAKITDLTNAAALTYSTSDIILFGTHNHPTCNQGLLVFQQNGRFGVIDFLDLNAAGELTVNFWLGNVGVTDFSGAPLQ